MEGIAEGLAAPKPMNKVSGIKEDGTHFLMLVLEPGNVHRIKNGDPILVRIEDCFTDGIPPQLELAIFYSETPAADFRHMQKEFGATGIDERTAQAQKKRPRCPSCTSTVEQMGMSRVAVPNDRTLYTFFCPMCGCVLGAQLELK